MSRKRDDHPSDTVVEELLAELRRLGLRVQAAPPDLSLEQIKRLMDADPSGTVH